MPTRDAPAEMPGGKGGVRDWQRDSAAPLCCVWHDMWGTGDGFPPSREQRKGGGYMWVGAVMPMRVRQRWRATRAAAVSLSRAAVSSWSAGSLDKTRQFS